MTIRQNDLFNDTDGVLLTAHTADSGGTYVGMASGYNTATPIITANRLRSNNAASQGYLGPTTETDAMKVGGPIKRFDSTACGAGFITRGTAAGAGYSGWYNTNGNIYIQKMPAGTVINSGTYSLADGATATMEIKATGTSGSVLLQLYINGTVVLSGTDSSSPLVALGKPGVFFTAASGATGGVHLESLTADDGASGDVTAPTFTSALVANGAASVIQVTMSEALAASVPANSACTAVGSTSGAKTASGVSIAGSVLSATFDVPFVAGETVTFNYTAPGSNPRIQDAAGNITGSFGPSAVSNNIVGALDTTKIRFSPFNWYVAGSSAKSINPGAYFSTLFSGATCALTFDLTGEMASPFSIAYRIDNFGPWRFATVATSPVTLDMTGCDTGYASNGGHLLEVVLRGVNAAATQRWNPQACAAVLTGITLDAGATLTLPPTVRAKKILFYGDSISEGAMSHSDSSNDALSAWTFIAGKSLAAEFGIVAFASQGWLTSYNTPAYSPTFPNSWDSIFSGQARSFASAPDLIVINMGTNDSSGDVTSVATSTLTAMLAATPSTTKIVVMRPFIGYQASQLQAAITAVGSARISYMDTTGWYDQTTNGNRVHPYAPVVATDIAPRAVNALVPVLFNVPASPTLTARTVTLTGIKTDASTLATGLTNVKVSFRDAASPDLAGAITYQSSTQTITGGVLTFSVNTSLASGAEGWLDVKAAGVHYCGKVAVA